MTTVADPFDLEQDGPPRDQWKRPLLIPAKGGERVAYTRASTLADFVDSNFGLTIWEKRLLAIGMALREDVCGLVAALPPLNDARCDKTTLTKAQKEQDADTKKKLDEYIEIALDAAGRNFKAHHGTAVHGFIEHRHVEQAPERMRPDVHSALDWFAEHDVEIAGSEVFTACDLLTSAGTFDHLMRVPTLGWVVGDVKTGQVKDKGLAFSVQLASYANGEVYNWHDDTRAPLESLTGGERVNRDWGVVLHVPLGAGKTQPYLIDLRRGLHCARLATHVRSARSLPDLCAPLKMQEQ